MPATALILTQLNAFLDLTRKYLSRKTPEVAAHTETTGQGDADV
jgi:hypothetical protein